MIALREPCWKFSYPFIKSYENFSIDLYVFHGMVDKLYVTYNVIFCIWFMTQMMETMKVKIRSEFTYGYKFFWKLLNGNWKGSEKCLDWLIWNKILMRLDEMSKILSNLDFQASKLNVVRFHFDQELSRSMIIATSTSKVIFRYEIFIADMSKFWFRMTTYVNFNRYW